MTKEVAEDEIDLVELLKKLWKARRFILVFSFALSLVGVAVALISPISYKAEVTFVPQTGDAKAPGGVSSLAALAGINLNADMGSEIPANLYPTLVGSEHYKLELLNTKVESQKLQKTVTFEEYLLEMKRGGLFDFLKREKTQKSNIKAPKDILSLDEKTYGLMLILGDIVSINVNEKEGFVSLSVHKIPEASVVAQVTKSAMELLQEMIIDYKVQNARKDLNFIESQYKEKEYTFLKVQEELALFDDSNKNIATALFQSKRQKIQTRYDLAFAVYKELAQQREQALLQVSKDTPIFSILRPVSVPNKRDAPKRSLIVIIFGFLGGVLSCGWVLIKEPLKSIQNEIRD
ncbi:MAG: Wzz/FepE/Etk N-terminal domain-containing protein [Flavobacteriaceae bacterium]